MAQILEYLGKLLDGEDLTFEDAGASGWDVSTTLSGTNILVQVNPDTTNAVEWISYTEIIDINTA